MTPVFQSLVLGVVQGITEFLPISSDGHLALVYKLFGSAPSLTYEVLLHGATLLAMIVFFWRDILRLLRSLALPFNPDTADDRRLVLVIVLATGISGVIALALGPVIEPLAASMTWVGVFFLCTAGALFVAEALASRVAHLDHAELISWPKTTFVAVMQGLAVLPGLSRSGTTIAAGVLSGLSRENAARFSFLLGIPIIALAAAKDVLDVAQGTGGALPGSLAAATGFVAAGLSGYAAISFLLGVVKRHRLTGFAIYTLVLGSIVFAWGLLGG